MAFTTLTLAAWLALSGVAAAQTFENLHFFVGGGASRPQAGVIQATDGNFYGTTYDAGAYNLGTVYRVTPAGTLTVLHDFTGQVSDGDRPTTGLLQASDGYLYGTTIIGTIFRMSLSGTFNVVHVLSGAEGGTIKAPLIQGNDGHLYGTSLGGAQGFGTIFRMTLTGTVTVLHTFAGGADGAYPLAALVQGTDGNFYGTTLRGGVAGCAPNGCGTVFKMTPAGVMTQLHDFAGSSSLDGAEPQAALIQATDGNFYGTTFTGGSPNSGSPASGTVFRITPSGTLTIMHSFTNSQTGGLYLYAGLVQATDGHLYGVTWQQSSVFRLTLGASFTSLTTSFSGSNPMGTLIQATDGSLYGTTQIGGQYNVGSVFKVTLGGAPSTVASLYRGIDGNYPSYGGLKQAADGFWYGTTFGGGTSGQGTLFKMSSNGALTTIYGFGTPSGPAYGGNPMAGVIQANDGTLWGATQSSVFKVSPGGTVSNVIRFSAVTTDAGGGTTGIIQAADGIYLYLVNSSGGGSISFQPKRGTILRMNVDGNYTVMHTFLGTTTDGAQPQGSLLQASDGNFYGASYRGGSADRGTVFKITPGGTFTILHSFLGGSDGSSPLSGLIQAADGNLYGTTSYGGASDLGTIYRITTAGVITVIRSFAGANGAAPYAPLMQAPDGYFYGTTYAGGENNLGTMFRADTNGTLLLLHSFSGVHGSHPYAPVSLGTDGNFYGTTYDGGAAGYGIVWRYSPVAGTAPAITQQPFSQTISAGLSATMTVSATGTASLSYQWYRGISGDTSSPIFGATSSSYTTPQLGVTTRYWVRVSNAFGAIDSNTAQITIDFADNPVTAGTTLIRAIHITELRYRIDAIRGRYGLEAFAYTDANLSAGTTPPRAQHIIDLRTAIQEAYAAAGMSAPSFTDPALAAGGAINALYISELRAAVLGIE